MALAYEAFFPRNPGLPDIHSNTLPPLDPPNSNRPRYYYSTMMQNPAYDTLYGKLWKTYGSLPNNPDHNVKRPLGAAYDEIMEHWIIADSGNNCIRFYTENSIVGDAAFGSLTNPSAVAVCVPGQTVAVLDDVGIRVYDYRNESFFTAAKDEGKRGKFDCRGLGCTTQGDLVTIQRTFNGGKINIYSSNQQNHLLRTFPYFAPTAPHGGQSRGPNPCFLDVGGDRIIVTDLGVNAFTVFDFDANQLNIRLRVQKECYGRHEGQFQFISGARFDAKGDILIADAGSERLQYFDDFGRFKHCVQFSDGFAYASGIAVNSHNELMVCDRKRSECKVYKLSGKPASEQRSGGSSSGYSGGAPRGGGGGRGNRGGGGSRPYRR